MLEQHTIANLLEWMDDKTLVVNRDFQRSNRVWSQPARAYLIDTILRGYPVPKIYLRTKINSQTRRAYREVVDGQQRLTAIRSFATDGFALGANKEVYGEFAGLKFSELDEDPKQTFLGYYIPVEQLTNVPDAVVFDIFQRLNTYNYNLTRQELRHGKYHGALKTAVVETSRRWNYLWSNYRALTPRARIRMADDELMAQMFGIILEGVTDGGQPKIDRLYERYDAALPLQTHKKVDRTIGYMVDNLSPALETGLASSPHLLMMFAAVAHALFGIPEGDMGDDMPERDSRALQDPAAAVSSLSALADVLEMDRDEAPERMAAVQRRFFRFDPTHKEPAGQVSNVLPGLAARSGLSLKCPETWSMFTAGTNQGTCCCWNCSIIHWRGTTPDMGRIGRSGVMPV